MMGGLDGGAMALSAPPEGVTPSASSGQAWRSYYYAGSTRIAMRVEGDPDPAKNGVYYLHADHLGSASLTTDAGGNKFSEERYTPFGETRSGSSPTDLQFTGQRRENGLGSLYDFQARHYSPLLGRFLSADTVIPGTGNPQAWNRYAYAFNNPLKYNDPSGHWPGWWNRINGGITQYMNDMTFGLFGKVHEWTTGATLDQVADEDFQQGREYGRAVAVAQGTVEAGVGGAAVLAGLTAGPLIVGGALVAAAPSGGLSILGGGLALTADGVMVAAGAVGAIHGGLSLAYIKNSPINKQTGSGSSSMTPDEIRKSIKSHEQRLAEHQAKLEAYIRDPDAFDNQGLLQNAPNEKIRQSIINGRIRHLQNEIDTFLANIEKLRAQLGE
jgi:RHS repeat-associated protein